MPRNTTPRTKAINVRLDDEQHANFIARADEYGGVSRLVRQLVQAFLDDAIHIQKPKSLYDFHNQ